MQALWGCAKGDVFNYTEVPEKKTNHQKVENPIVDDYEIQHLETDLTMKL